MLAKVSSILNDQAEHPKQNKLMMVTDGTLKLCDIRILICVIRRALNILLIYEGFDTFFDHTNRRSERYFWLA